MAALYRIFIFGFYFLRTLRTVCCSGCTTGQVHSLSEGPLFFLSLPALAVCGCTSYSRSVTCEMILTCISLSTSDASIFSYVCWTSVCSLWKNICPGPLARFFVITFFGFVGVKLYDFLTCFGFNHLSDVSLVDIFSHLVGCLLYVVNGFFCCEKTF